MAELANTLWMCFGVLAKKCKDINEWVRRKLGKKKIVPQCNSPAQIIAGTRRVPGKVLDTTVGHPIVGKLKSQNREP
jgi:hypothetical protein